MLQENKGRKCNAKYFEVCQGQIGQINRLPKCVKIFAKAEVNNKLSTHFFFVYFQTA